MDSTQLHLRQASPTRQPLFRTAGSYAAAEFRLRALCLALGLKPIVQAVTLSPSALLVKFVGALLNLLLNWDQDGRLVRLRCECGLGSGLVHVVAGSFLFFDLVWTAIYPKASSAGLRARQAAKRDAATSRLIHAIVTVCTRWIRRIASGGALVAPRSCS